MVVGKRRALIGGRAPWAIRGSSVDFDFTHSRVALNGRPTSLTSLLATTRASTGYAPAASGLLVPFPANVPRIVDQGILVEEPRTNVVLFSNDLTNAAWTKTSVTAAFNQTGPDGVANNATSLTATGSNGTAVQAITLGSSARFQTAYIKRITGTGVVNMTMDNGATWTAVTVTSTWTRVSIPTQTLANPTVGFQIVTNGDAVAVAFVDNENGAFATSPILTTAVAVTRAADSIMPIGPALAAIQALVGWARIATPFGVQNAGSAVLIQRQISTANEAMLQASTSTAVRSIAGGSGTATATIGASGTWAAKVVAASTWDSTGIANAANGGTVATGATPFAAGPSADPRLGSKDGSTANSFADNFISRLTFGYGRLSNAQLQSLAS